MQYILRFRPHFFYIGQVRFRILPNHQSAPRVSFWMTWQAFRRWVRKLHRMLVSRGNEGTKTKTNDESRKTTHVFSPPRCWCGLPFPTQWNVSSWVFHAKTLQFFFAPLPRFGLIVELLPPSPVLTSSFAVWRFYDLQLNVRDESGAEITSLEDFWRDVFPCNEIRSIHSFHELQFCSVLCYLSRFCNLCQNSGLISLNLYYLMSCYLISCTENMFNSFSV